MAAGYFYGVISGAEDRFQVGLLNIGASVIPVGHDGAVTDTDLQHSTVHRGAAKEIGHIGPLRSEYRVHIVGAHIRKNVGEDITEETRSTHGVFLLFGQKASGPCRHRPRSYGRSVRQPP